MIQPFSPDPPGNTKSLNSLLADFTKSLAVESRITSYHDQAEGWVNSRHDVAKRLAHRNKMAMTEYCEEVRAKNLELYHRMKSAGMDVRFLNEEGMIYIQIGKYQKFLESDEEFAAKALEMLEHEFP